LRELYPEVFASEDQARWSVRAARGEAKANEREPLEELVRTEEQKKRAQGWKKFIPETDMEEWSPVVLPKGKHRILLLSDIHIPYHDPSALNMAFEYGEKKGFDTIILNGDTLDFHAASRFVKDPRKRDLFGEINMCREFLQDMRAYYPDAKIIYKDGNHDERWQIYLHTHAPGFAKFAQFRLDNMLELEANKIQYVTDKRPIKAGKLNIVHGHEMGGSVFSPVNPARGLYMRAKESSICGHHHRTSEHTEQTINGSIIGTWSTGCLSELHPQYLPINNWNLGFAMVEVDGDEFHVENKKIIKGKV
jgi:predicted phosphodiesterase